MPYTVTTQEGASQERLNTGGGGARHIDTSPDGTIWYGQRIGGNFAMYYSKDGGVTRTWSNSTSVFNGQITHAGDFSMFIDIDGYMHVLYSKWVSASDGRTGTAQVTYRRGTPNAGNTAWTWTGEFAMTGSDYWHCPQVVAHRNPAGAGWIVHVVANYNWSGDNRTIVYHRTLSIDTAGNIAWLGGAGFLHDVSGAQTYHGHVSMEFRHNGDGKTVQLVNGSPKPDLYFSWTSSNQIHHGRLAYSGGTSWTPFEYTWSPDWGRVQGTSPYMEGLYQHHRWNKTLYDAASSRWIVIGMLSNAAVTVQNLVIWEYGADGKVLQYARAFGASPYFYSGNAALLPDGNIELTGVTNWNPGASTLSRAIITRPPNNGARDIIGIETIDTNVSDPNVSMLHYPKSSVQAFWNKPPATYIGRRSLSNLWMLIGGVAKNVVRYRNVGGVATPIATIKKGT